jgi:hypothetical protein
MRLRSASSAVWLLLPKAGGPTIGQSARFGVNLISRRLANGTRKPPNLVGHRAGENAKLVEDLVSESAYQARRIG